MSQRVKIKVGQVWEFSHDGELFHISKIDESSAWHDGGNRFTNIEKDGWAYLDDGWILRETIPTLETPSPAPVHQKDTLAFFKAVQAGNCPCNILRSQCDFHRF